MKILGIDTSALTCTVGLRIDGENVVELSQTDQLTHSETLLPNVKSALESARLRLEELDCIAVSSGPGSFTGLRIGIATVKGLAGSLGIPCVGVSTLEALAVNLLDHKNAVVCPVMDARRNEFYTALFSIKDCVLTRLTPDLALSKEKIASLAYEHENFYLLGDGAAKFVGLYPSLSSCLVPECRRLQSGISVAIVGERDYRDGKAVSCKILSPSYLRLPQAEREWCEKNQTI